MSDIVNDNEGIYRARWVSDNVSMHILFLIPRLAFIGVDEATTLTVEEDIGGSQKRAEFYGRKRKEAVSAFPIPRLPFSPQREQAGQQLELRAEYPLNSLR